MTLLSERLQTARRELFVGRVIEQALFQDALLNPQPPYSVLYVHGLGGVGKTMLLREFAALCAASAVPSITLDGRNLDPSPEAFLTTLSQMAGIEKSDALPRFFSECNGRYVIFIDTYELLAPLDGWLREQFLPQLPDNVLVVLAGRQPPARDWLIDSGWQSLLRTLSLRNLSPEESHGYLSQRNVPENQQAAILSFTHGHPLALSLVADLFAQHQVDSQISTIFAPEGAPDTVKVLVEHLIQEVSGERQRAAIEVCALVRLTTESLLHEILPPEPGQPAAHELFAWLRSLSFIEVGPAGLFPHDLAREAIVADLRWRDPERYAELHNRARNYYASRLQQTSGRQQQTILFEYIFLHRSNAVVRPFLEWRESGSLIPVAAGENDIPSLLAMVEKHEGAESAQIAAHWFARQLNRVVVLRDANGQSAGFLAAIALQHATTEDLHIDPAAQAAVKYLESHAPLRAGEEGLLFRFWMAADTYQAVSPAQSLIFVNIVQQYLTTPGLAFTFLACAEPDFWAPIFAYAATARTCEADFAVGSRHYGTYSHDWRAIPPLAWLSQMGDQEIAASSEMPTAPVPVEQMVVLSEAEFRVAVQAALRHLSRPGELRNNPLLRSRLVMEQSEASTTEKRVEALQQLVQTTCAKLQQTPRTEKLYWPLYHTYLHPAPSQEQAAETIHTSFSTFRRHLKEGVARVTETLWQQEIHL